MNSSKSARKPTKVQFGMIGVVVGLATGMLTGLIVEIGKGHLSALFMQLGGLTGFIAGTLFEGIRYGWRKRQWKQPRK